MQVCIDQNVLSKFPNLTAIGNDDVVMTIKMAGDNNSDFLFPLNFPLHNLDNLSWAMIDEIGRAGKAKTFFVLGATKKDYMKNGFVAEYQIMDFDHDDLADDSGKAPISWDMVALYKDEIYMKRNSESSCWDECDGREFLNGDFYNNMSDELRAIVKPVWKLTANKNGEIIKSKDYVWLKSEKELYGRTFYSNEGEGHWYELFMQEDFPWFKLNGENERDWQWLRSVYAGYTTSFCIVSTDGSPNYSYSGFSGGVAPAFCS